MLPKTTIFKVFLAWLPFFATWVLFRMAYGDPPFLLAVRSAGIATGMSAVLSLGVWWFTGRAPWPERVRPLFYAAHLAAGAAFAVAWTVLSYVLPALERGASLLNVMLDSEVLSWRLLMGLWLYGLVAGVSYAVRTRQRLREQERIAARAQALAAQARLQNLRARLNPHFLFIALHSVSSLIHHDPTKAEHAVEELGDLLRYALDEEGEEVVTLAEEWRFTRDYLALQPLVENAVQHSIAPHPEGGSLAIKTARREGALTITVQDDGPGGTTTNGLIRPGHGLHTLQERLHVRYGDAASLTLATAPGDGFRMQVIIPQQKASSSDERPSAATAKVSP